MFIVTCWLVYSGWVLSASRARPLFVQLSPDDDLYVRLLSSWLFRGERGALRRTVEVLVREYRERHGSPSSGAEIPVRELTVSQTLKRLNLSQPR
jgi:hypothetical protein